MGLLKICYEWWWTVFHDIPLNKDVVSLKPVGLGICFLTFLWQQSQMSTTNPGPFRKKILEKNSLMETSPTWKKQTLGRSV